MSKKHSENSNTGYYIKNHEEEYALIKRDLVKVVLLNAVYLAAIIGLYYSNLQKHFLENWFGRIFPY